MPRFKSESRTQLVTYRVHLLPTGEQIAKLNHFCGGSRFIWNQLVARFEKQSFSDSDLNVFIAELKEQHPWLRGLSSSIADYNLSKYRSARNALATHRRKGRKVGHIRFIRKGEHDTFYYRRSGRLIFDHGRTVLRLSKLGDVEVRAFREIRGVIKTIGIKRVGQRWWAFLSVELFSRPTFPRTINPARCVGLDMGLKNYAYTSKGDVINPPRDVETQIQRLERRLKHVQRKLGKGHRIKGSQNWKKAKSCVARLHERIRRKRHEFMHVESRRLTNRYDVIFLDKLRIPNMVKNHNLAKAIAESSWATFNRFLAYKANLSVDVPAKNTTIKCSGCGKDVPKTLAVRTHKCQYCGLVLDRDHNSARNTEQRGLDILKKKGFTVIESSVVSTLEQDLPVRGRDVMPVEVGVQRVGQRCLIAQPVVEAGSSTYRGV